MTEALKYVIELWGKNRKQKQFKAKCILIKIRMTKGK
jgi:hypothetical protein